MQIIVRWKVSDLMCWSYIDCRGIDISDSSIVDDFPLVHLVGSTRPTPDSVSTHLGTSICFHISLMIPSYLTLITDISNFHSSTLDESTTAFLSLRYHLLWGLAVVNSSIVDDSTLTLDKRPARLLHGQTGRSLHYTTPHPHPVVISAMQDSQRFRK